MLSARRLLCHACLWLIPSLVVAGAPSADAVTAGWEALANNRPDTALRMLGNQPSSRAERLAWAAARMGEQPATDDHMREAEGVLTDLMRGDDEIGAQAEYLRARLYQLHLAQPDAAKAAASFRALADRRPHSHWAQLGLVKLALLKLFVLPDSTAPDADRLAPAEALLAQIHEPLLLRDLHFQIGQAGVVLKQPLTRLLPHLVEADRIGGVSGTAGEDLLVQLGVLSLRAGRPAEAKEYCERYLRDYPTNVRAFTMEQKLAEAKRLLAAEGAR